MSTYTDVLIIGAVPSGIGSAVRLTQKFKNCSFSILKKDTEIGGTWFQNSYPGCGCDVASHFYSFSFSLNPRWSKVYSMQPEIQQYFRSVAEQYDIPHRVEFNSEVTCASWDAKSSTWMVSVKNLTTKETRQRRCKILISAVGSLSIPQDCDITGAATFKGRLFHSARWDHSFNWKGKEVVAIGNGCSATQFIPVISAGEGAVKKVTQFSRQPHWLSKRVNPDYSKPFIWTMTYVPGALRLYRAYLYWEKEQGFKGFDIVRGQKLREQWTRDATKYIRETAPAKYIDALIPTSVIGCKRRVNDTGYLDCLHQPNVELVHDDPIERIVEDGVETRSGRHIKAEAIMLATGFQAHRFLSPIVVKGENGVSLNEHWQELSNGTPEAYFGTCYSGFPNFFTMMGPNTVTGHLSVIFTVECQINFTMRAIEPIMKSLEESKLQREPKYPDSVVVRLEAQRADNDWIQEKCKQLVWSTGCTSWFIDPATAKNTQMYPDWQYLFWARSVWVPWQDFSYRLSGRDVRRPGRSIAKLALSMLVLGTVVGGQIVGWAESRAMVQTFWGTIVQRPN